MCDNKQIVIEGPDQILYQWDTGQRLRLHGYEPGTRVDFARCNQNKAASVYAYAEGGEVFCDIPDAILMEPNHIRGFVYVIDGGRGETVRNFLLPVIPRPKPEDYVEPEEVPTWHELEQRIKKIEDEGVPDEKIERAVEDYLEENPIEAPKPDLTGVVKSVNGKTPDENGNVEITIPDSSQNAALTAAQIAALDGMFKVCAYNGDPADAYAAFMDAFGLNVPATGITLSKTALNFADTASQLITATVEPSNSTDAVIWTTSAPGVATVVNGVVTPVANGNCTITATAGKVSASCSVSVAFEVEVVYYTITNNLTNCASNNNAASIVEGGSYTATLTASEGYTLDGANISVMVNGEDVTDTAYRNGVITIQRVLGDVVITAAAVEEVADDGGEVVMLKNISFDGTSYLDTEVIPESINYRYVLGIQAPNKDIVTKKNIGGISMRDNTAPDKSAYWDLYWYCSTGNNSYNADVPFFNFQEIRMTPISKLTAGMDKGDGAATTPYDYPVYYNLDNGSQSMWKNEDCTEAPVAGHFPGVAATVDYTAQSYYTDDEHPIDSIWLGKVHVTGIMGSLATEANTYAGAKFYCFKVYDSDENLIADMRPAKQGNAVGMWDNVRNKFYSATGTANYEEVSA